MKLFTLISALVLASLLGSCNTFIGMGRDMKILGDGMESSANKASGGGGDTSGGTSGAPVY
ncbi:MAG: hypothetical protein K9N23_04165 [Akkermansiaceae bacterium]|nr:hypothetical protein [Akkermansiaceae bacterium]MCF7730854.1 hypothetical protein [Akkermansiaceae bacterium]